MGRREKRVSADGTPGGKLGAAMRLARHENGISLSKLAQRLSYTRGYLSAIETGVEWPSRELVEAYERELGVLPGQLTQLADSLAPARRQSSSAERTREAVGDLLAYARQGVGRAPELEESNGQPAQLRTLPALAQQRVLPNLEEALQLATELVQDLARAPAPPGQTIVFTSTGGSDAFSPIPALASQWRQTLRTALAQGWGVVHLFRFDRDRDTHFDLVAEVLGLVGFAGHYQPYWLPQPVGAAVPYDLLIVPGKGAMLFLATRQKDHADAACFFPDNPDLLAFLRNHVEMLRSHATPFLNVYRCPAYSQRMPHLFPDVIRFDYAITRAELEPGDGFLVKDGLNNLLLPITILQERVSQVSKARGEEQNVWIHTLVENRLRRVAVFHDHVRTWRFREICTKRAIEKLVTSGSLLDHGWLQPPPAAQRGMEGADEPPVLLTPKQRADYLQAVADFLKAYPNYEIGLLDDPVAGAVVETAWAIRGQGDAGMLFLKTWYLEGDERVEINLEITHAAVVQAFRAYFLDLWESLPGLNQDKNEVIAWLEAQIAQIPEISSPTPAVSAAR
ncbi:MAG: helix-turn-helix transcriptional regulator [Chloroflexi bacterium]|nr:helix-turn-helix transcriptional regulator [Chloroflexota bacterium]